MKTTQEEEYVFYRFASGDILQAQHSLKKVAQYKREGPKSAFSQQAVLSYCRPFKSCRGKYGTYRLTKSFIPKEYSELHGMLIEFRDQVYAHTDLNVRRPALAKWRSEKGTIHPIRFRGLSIDVLVKRRADFKSLIDIVINRIYQQTEILDTWLP